MSNSKPDDRLDEIEKSLKQICPVANLQVKIRRGCKKLVGIAKKVDELKEQRNEVNSRRSH